MKFDDKLDYFENGRAWRLYAESIDRTPYSALSPAELIRIEDLHTRLKEIEHKLYPIIQAKYKTLSAQVAAPENWMDDFNLSLWLSYYLREDDPECEEQSDNILMEKEYHYHGPSDWGFCVPGINYAEPSFPSENADHCYLFHDLYDHSSLDWRDLLRIGQIVVEIKIDEQAWFSV